LTSTEKQMLFIVRFTDKPNMLALRQSLLTAHVLWLDQHQATILAAGSLRREPGETPVGSCWIVEAKDNAEIETLLRADPFWVGGLRQSHEVLHWSKAFDRKVPI